MKWNRRSGGIIGNMQDAGPGGVLFDRQYSYNTANQISQIAELTGTKVFGYDNIDRLTSVADAVNGNESYAFDGVGNRTASHLSNTYTHQPFNRLTATETGSYAHDANGNTVSKVEGSKRWTYSWDYENRLTAVSDRKTRQRHIYDALGRRVQTYGGPAGSVKFTYDGLDVVTDNSSVSGITKYQNGPGIDNKLSLKNGADIKYFLTDHQLSTYALTNSGGNVLYSQTFDSYGNVSNSSFPTRFQYTGREYDVYTGLYHYRARSYDSKTGRFLTEDPLGFVGGMNLYAYVGNSPVKFTDPFGWFPSIWPFDYHSQMGTKALSGYASQRDIQSVNNGNEKFDADTQDLEYANYHAMRRPGQSPEAAKAFGNAFVRSRICLARKYESMGWHTDALHEFGKAAHALQDAESPAHSGFQEAWPNTYLQILRNIWHYPKEMFFYSDDERRRAENNTLRAWGYFKGYPMPTDLFSGTGSEVSCECPK